MSEPKASERRQADAGKLDVTVFGPSGSARTLTLPGDVPVAELWGVLGDAAGVAAMTSVVVRGGGILRPTDTLTGAGVPAGAALLVAGSRSTAGSGAHREGGEQGGRRDRRRRRSWTAVAAGLVVGLVAGGIIGAVAFRREQSASSALSPAQASTANGAVADWLAGRGGPPGRTGGAIRARFEPVGAPQAPAGAERVQRFVVLPSAAPPFGLTVALAGSAAHPTVAFPLGYTGLVYATGAIPPGGGATSAVGLSGAVANWSSAVFGPKGTLTTTLGAGQVGPVRVVAARAPGTPDVKAVLLVLVPLSANAPGTPGGNASAAARRDAQALAQANQKVAGDQTAVSRANASSTQAFLSANVPAFQIAQAQLVQAQAALQADQTAAFAAQQRAAASAAQARRLAPASTVTASYDLVVNDRDQVVAWSAGGYDGS